MIAVFEGQKHEWVALRVADRSTRWALLTDDEKAALIALLRGTIAEVGP